MERFDRAYFAVRLELLSEFIEEEFNIWVDTHHKLLSKSGGCINDADSLLSTDFKFEWYIHWFTDSLALCSREVDFHEAVESETFGSLDQDVVVSVKPNRCSSLDFVRVDDFECWSASAAGILEQISPTEKVDSMNIWQGFGFIENIGGISLNDS